MSKRVILIHGFNVRDGGEGSIDKLKPLLKDNGYEPIDFDYGLSLIQNYVRYGMDL